MKMAELVMAPDWPEPEAWRRNLTNAPALLLYWPVAHLPASMGWLPLAQKLPGERTGQYFLEVYASFYPDGVSIYGAHAPDGETCPHAFIEHEELEHLIEDADTAVRRQSDPPPRLTLYRPYQPTARRYAAYLGVRDSEADEADFAFDDVPF
jgi:hypothetical protein